MNGCPAFEVLSRFADGQLEPAEEAPLVSHLAACAACRATLSDIEGVDALVGLTLPAARGRFRLLRPALIPAAAAVLFAVVVGWILLTPGNGADSPLAVADESPRPFDAPRTVPAEPVKDIFCQDHFAAPQLSSLWRTTDAVPAQAALVEAHGRRALSLVTHPGGKKRWALASTAGDFPVGEGVTVDVDYRIPRPSKGGRMQILLQSPVSKGGRSVLRWSWTSDEELLEAQTDGRSKPAVLWSAKNEAFDSEWHRVQMTVTPRDIVLRRDGAEAARKPHGLDLERAGLTVGGTADKRAKDLREPFECQVGGVVVRRENAQ